MKYSEVTKPESKVTLPVFEENYEEVCSELKSLSEKMLELLPDPSIGPEERLERIARVAPHTLMKSQNVKTARTKLYNLRQRLDELVPSQSLSSIEKLNLLLDRINELVPGDQRLFEKLEELGDSRVSDIGR